MTVEVRALPQPAADRRRRGPETTDRQLLSIPEAWRLAGQAEVISTVLSPTGRPLPLGRQRRLVSSSQTYVLITRDGGCSFPGWTVRPRWCDRHAQRDWADGGCTDPDDLTLCRYHHTHVVTAGWVGRRRRLVQRPDPGEAPGARGRDDDPGGRTNIPRPDGGRCATLRACVASTFSPSRAVPYCAATPRASAPEGFFSARAG